MNIYYYRKLKNVNRLGTAPISRQYNLLEHSYMVTILFCHFAKREGIEYDASLLETIMHHDILEVVTGDLPWNVKNYNSTTQEAWDAIEEHAVLMEPQLAPYTDAAMSKSMTGEQHELFKVCDMLELWIFLQEELRLGNKSSAIWEIIQRAKDNIQGRFKSVDDYMLTGYAF